MNTFRKAMIIGGGPAGASCACWLRRLGFPEVIILERQPRGRDKTCAGGISPRAIPELRQLGLFEQVKARAKVIRGAYLWRPDGRAPLELLDKLALSIRRSTFDALLLDHAEHLGAQVEHDVAVDRLLEEEGVVRGVGAGEREHEADVVILATGARHRLCWDPRPRRLVESIIWRFEREPPEPDMLHFNYHRRIAPFYVWLFPEPEGTVNIGCCRYPGEGGGA